MKYFALIFSVCLGTSTSLLSKIIKKSAQKISETTLSNTLTFLSALLTVFILGATSATSQFFSNFSDVPWALVIGYGSCLFLAQLSFLFAVSNGSVSISTLFYSCGFILPSAWGILRFNEPVKLLQIVGVSLIICAFILSANVKKEEKKGDIKWLLYALGGLVFSGGIGIFQKEFRAVNPCSSDVFLFCAFLCASLFSAIATFVFYRLKRKTDDETKSPTRVREFLFNASILGAIMGLANLLNTYLAGVFESVITFPVVNGGRILLTSVCVALLFKEKTNLRQKTGILLGFIAILLIALA